jgi:hypothetical protein
MPTHGLFGFRPAYFFVDVRRFRVQSCSRVGMTGQSSAVVWFCNASSRVISRHFAPAEGFQHLNLFGGGDKSAFYGEAGVLQPSAEGALADAHFFGHFFFGHGACGEGVGGGNGRVHA